MTNVSRQWWRPVNTDLVYYLIHYDSTTVHTDDAVNVSAVVLADAGVNGSLVQSALSAADDTCELMMTVDRQLVAILLRHVVITQCQGTYQGGYIFYAGVEGA